MDDLEGIPTPIFGEKHPYKFDKKTGRNQKLFQDWGPWGVSCRGSKEILRSTESKRWAEKKMAPLAVVSWINTDIYIYRQIYIYIPIYIYLY